MIEFTFVLLFTAAGIGAALLALRLAGGSPAVRWLAWAFCFLALANLGLHIWRIVATDLHGMAQLAGIAALLLLFVWAYRRFLRALRGMADRRGS